MECGSPIKHRPNDPDARRDKAHAFTSAAKTPTWSCCGNTAPLRSGLCSSASEVIIPASPFRSHRSVHDLARNDWITHKQLVVLAEFQPDGASGWT